MWACWEVFEMLLSLREVLAELFSQWDDLTVHDVFMASLDNGVGFEELDASGEVAS
jgi:hypothetical protein